MRGPDTAVRLRPKLVHDPYSGKDTLGSWDDPERLEFRCFFAQGTPDEAVQVDLETSTALATLYTTLGVDIKPEDRVEVRGRLWAVVGITADWVGTARLATGSVVRLRLIREKA